MLGPSTSTRRLRATIHDESARCGCSNTPRWITLVFTWVQFGRTVGDLMGYSTSTRTLQLRLQQHSTLVTMVNGILVAPLDFDHYTAATDISR